MAAPKGNVYWKLAKSWGRDMEYSPLTLWEKAVEYFKWVESNPLYEDKVFGSGLRMSVGKVRAMTIRGFCVFAHISTETFRNYEASEDFFGITSRIRDVIYTQKFEGAAAGLLETNIIARELGLADKQSVEVVNEISRSPLNDCTVEQLEAIERILNGNG